MALRQHGIEHTRVQEGSRKEQRRTLSIEASEEKRAHAPRSSSPLGFGGEYDTSSTILQPSGQVSPLVSKTHLNAPNNGDSHLSLSFGVPTYPFLPHSGSDPGFVPSVVRPVPSTPNTSVMVNPLARDPEALLDTKHFAAVDAVQTDPSTMTIALITTLGLLSSHSANPRVAVFQLSAAAISFSLIALHAFHSNRANAGENTFVQRLLKYFPMLIFVSCWSLFLLSITVASPKAMAIVVCLVVLASIPMVGGVRLPAALTLAVMTLFSLTFFAFVFLVCVLPTEWLA